MHRQETGFKRSVGPWIPFAFCAALSGIVVVSGIRGEKWENTFPAFFCFLPMTFFFLAPVIVELKKEIKQLSDRIDQLESKQGQPPT